MTIRMPVVDRRAQLVDAALTVASTEGIEATTVRRVAERAGVALGVVHYCFADKNELISTLATRIVEESAAASVAQRGVGSEAELTTSMRSAVAALWTSIESARDKQLLMYEITTHSLRNPELRPAGLRRYAVSQVAVERLLAVVAAAGRTSWTRPNRELAADVLAFLDGITLRWLVDADGTAARARLDSVVAYVATFSKVPARPRPRPRPRLRPAPR